MSTVHVIPETASIEQMFLFMIALLLEVQRSLLSAIIIPINRTLIAFVRLESELGYATFCDM